MLIRTEKSSEMTISFVSKERKHEEALVGIWVTRSAGMNTSISLSSNKTEIMCRNTAAT